MLSILLTSTLGILGRPFLKRFALRYRTAVLSVTLVYCGQTVGCIKMKLGMQVGLGPGHTVFGGLRWRPSSPPPKGLSPQFSAHICCGQMAAWIKMPLGTEIGRGPGDCVRWSPKFLAHVYCGPTADGSRWHLAWR